MENTAAANCNIRTKLSSYYTSNYILYNILQYYQSWRDHRLMLPDNMTSEYRLLPVDNHQLFLSTSPNFHFYGLWGSWIWPNRLGQIGLIANNLIFVHFFTPLHIQVTLSTKDRSKTLCCFAAISPPVPYPRHPSSLCCASTPSLTFSLQGIVVEQHVGQQVAICFLRQLFCCANISSASVVVSPPGVTEV